MLDEKKLSKQLRIWSDLGLTPSSANNIYINSAKLLTLS